MFQDFSPRKIRSALRNFLTVITVLTSSYMMYKTLGVIANTNTPVVVVLSGSMEPAFQRGDVLFLWNRGTVATGDIVVYDTDNRDIPIVHRVVRDHSSDRKQLVLTKGDNNPVDDLDLYGGRRHYLDRAADINGGKVWGYVPWLGYATIYMSEHPQIRNVIIGASMLLTLSE